MVETTEEYRNRINQLKTGIENEPYIKKMRENIAEGISKTGNRQADIEDQFQQVIDNTTGKDVIAAPELIAARNGEANLKARLDKEKQQVNAQLAQTEDDLNTKLVSTKADLQNQVDTVIASAGNPESSSAEIIQARVDSNGSSFRNLKKHFDNIENIIFNAETFLDFGDWKIGTILSNGTVGDLTRYIYTENKHTNTFDNPTKIQPINGYKVAVAYYNPDGSFNNRTPFSDSAYTIVPDFAEYRLCITLDETTVLTTDAKNNLIISKKAISKDSNRINETVAQLRESFLTNENIIFFDDWEQGAIGSTGSILNNKTFIRNSNLQKIALGNKVKLEVKNGFKARLHWYDEGGTHVSATNYVQSEEVFTAIYPKFKIILSYNEVDRVYPADVSNLTVKVMEKNDDPNKENVLAGKKLVSFGTSILAGHHAGISFPNYVAENLGMSYTRKAVNGARVIGTGTGTIINQITNAPQETFDSIILDGGANDMYPENTNDPAKMGTISEGFDAELDLTTYCGSLEYIFKTLKSKYFGAMILFVEVHKLNARLKESQSTVARLNKEIATKWGVDYLDMLNDSNLNTYIEAERVAYSYDDAGTTTGGSGTHLNELGNKKYYVPKVIAKLREMFAY